MRRMRIVQGTHERPDDDGIVKPKCPQEPKARVQTQADSQARERREEADDSGGGDAEIGHGRGVGLGVRLGLLGDCVAASSRREGSRALAKARAKVGQRSGREACY